MLELPATFIDASLSAAAGISARRGGGSSLVVLTYHRVLEAPDPLLPSEPDAEVFAAQMAFLARHCHVLSLPEAARALREGRLPRKAVCISFDDGYANNVRVALPILKEFGLPASFFIATGYIDGGIMWNDAVIEAVRGHPGPAIDARPDGLGCYALGDTAARRAAINQLLNQLKYRPPAERSAIAATLASRAGVVLPADLMMTSAGVRQLAEAGMDIGGHTVSHPILARLPEDEARREIVAGREALARLTGRAPRSFAYPNGRPGRDFDRSHATMVRDAGFECAVTTAWGCAGTQSDPCLLPRVTLWSRTPSRLAANMAAIWARRERRAA